LDRYFDERGWRPKPGEEHEPPSTIMQQTYSLLSDHAHPNHGAVHLSSALDAEGMDWARAGPIDEQALDVIIAPTALAMYGGGRAFDEATHVANNHRLDLPTRGLPRGTART
jgi:hypothetical protein